MSDDNLEVFHGGTFVFEVPRGRFTLYKKLVERKSRILAAMMEIGMQESQNGVATLKDTDVATLGRFAEWLITGDYNAAEPLPRSEHDIIHANSEAPIVEVEYDNVVSTSVASTYEGDDCPDFWTSLNRKKGRKARKNTSAWTWERSPTPSSPPPSPPASAVTSDVEISKPLQTCSMFVPNGDWTSDHLPVFLSHAELFVFSDKHEVPDLQTLTVRRLEEALQQFKFVSPCATGFAELLEYVYDHTAEKDNSVDVMRMVVTNFAAKNIKSLLNSERFGNLIMGGPLAFDVLKKSVAGY